ncbi:MAG: hypothetical protein CM15mP109_07300 [Candidatus Dadabacteria bacterium]|nr:MAG: hypothetical protein CM15mP109_07300 [Candidatus Dadabacteria bacterium]
MGGLWGRAIYMIEGKEGYLKKKTCWRRSFLNKQMDMDTKKEILGKTPIKFLP